MNYIQQAYKGKNDWTYYLAVLFLVFLGWQIIGIIPLVVTAVIHSKDLSEFTQAANNNFMNLGINNNLFLFLMVIMFAFGLLFLFIGIKYVHKRSVASLITSRKKVDWNRVFIGFFTWGLIAGVMSVIGIYIAPEDYIWNFKPIPFFVLVVISMLFLPLQTSFEELFFRGYLMQGFGTLFKNRWLPLILTSAIFGLLHFSNPEVAKLGNISMVFYIGTGLFYGIITLMDEGTELALGLHAINNMIAAVLVTTDWTVFQTDALYIDTSEPSVNYEMFIPVFVLYPLMLLFFAQKYQWKNWQEKLLGRIEKPTEIE